MKIVDRYIGKQVLFSTLFAVLVLSVVLVLGNILQKMMGLLSSGVPLEIIVQFVGYILPFSMVFTVPWGFLTAILLTFGRLSADNELISLRMAGLSVPRICCGVFFLAISMSLFCLWINVSVAPRAELAMSRLAYRAALDNPLSLFSADQVTEGIPGHRIYVGEKRGNELFNFQMVKLDNKKAANFVTARRVVVTPSEDGGELLLEMHDAQVYFVPPKPGSSDDRREGGAPDLEIPVRGVPVDVTTKKRPFSSAVHPVVISLEKLAKKSNRVRASQLSVAQLDVRMEDESLDAEARSSLRVEKHKRFSFSLACLTFCLIGVPLGITAQRRETSAGFVLSLVVAVVYFMFIILADTFKRNPGVYPHLLIWLPNVLFLSLGGWLFWRLSRR